MHNIELYYSKLPEFLDLFDKLFFRNFDFYRQKIAFLRKQRGKISFFHADFKKTKNALAISKKNYGYENHGPKR